MGAVFVRHGPPADRVEAMSGALQGFGAKSAVVRDGPVGLVRVVSAPFSPEDAFDRGIVRCEGGQQVVFQGRLHHRDDLARALGVKSGRAERMADPDLFARAWERWGREAAVRAEGSFAVVVWDGAGRVLTALCSPLSSPPLYFSVMPRRVVVASTPRGVHAGSGVPRRINDARLASSLILDPFDLRSSYFEGVQSLASGEALVVESGAHRVHQFWNTADHVRPVRMPRTQDYVQTGRELLRAAVADAMRSCETPTMLLSGGMDSTAVAANALELLAERPGAAPLISFTARPAEGWDGRCAPVRNPDEWPLVRALAEMYPSLDARFVRAQNVAFDHLSQPIMELAELPQRNVSNSCWGLACLSRAQATGRRVIMTGGMGNFTLSYHGYERLASLLWRGRWAALRTEAAHLPRGQAGRILVRETIVPFLPRPLVRALRCWRRQEGWSRYSAIHPSFAHDMRVDQRARRHGFDPYYSSQRSRLKGQLQVLLVGAAGEGRAMSLAVEAFFGIAKRDPYWDRRLVLWCLGLPDELYHQDGRARRLIPLLMDGRVPDGILTARRRGRQAADWHFRLTRELPRIRGEIEEWRDDPDVAERLDLDRLLRVLDTWPSQTPLSGRDHPDYPIVRWGLGRALAAGRFIRFVEGSR